MSEGVQVGSAYVSLGGDVAPLHGALQEANRSVSSWAENTQSSMRRIAEIATGTLIGNVLPRITSGFAGMAKEALGAVADYERLGMSLESLVAKELRQASTITTTTVVGQRRVELTQQEKEKLQELGLQRDVYAAKLQEESERHRQLVAKWGEEGLAVKTHAANMAMLQNKYNETGAAIAGLEGKQGKLVSVTQTNSKTTLSMAEAMAQAGPKAKELIRWIEQLAIKSPFGQEDVANAFRLAQTYGFVSDSADKSVVSAKRLTQAMIDFTAATGADGSKMTQVAQALGKIQSTGKVSGEEIRQLAEAGLSVTDILAKAFGKSTGEISKMTEKGLIPADKAILAIVKSIEEDFGGAAARQTTTFSGLLNSLSDIQKLDLRTFFDSAFVAAKPFLIAITDFLSSDAFLAKLDALGERFGQFVGQIIAAGQKLIGAFQTGGLTGLLQALGLSPQVVAIIQGMIGNIQTLADTVRNGIGAALVWVRDNVLPALSQAVTFVMQNWDAFKGALMGVAALIGGAALLGTLMSLAGTLAALANPITLIIGLAAALGAAWSTNFMGIRDVVMPVITAIQGGIQTFISSLQSGQSVFMAIGSAINSLLTPLIGAKDAMSASTEVMNGLQSAWSALTGFIDQVTAAVGNAVTAFQNVSALGGSPFEALGAGLEQFLGSFLGLGDVVTVVTQVQEVWAQLVAFFEPTIERLTAAWPEMIASLAPLQGKLQELWAAAEPILTVLAEVVGVVVVAAFNLLLEIVAAVMPSIGSIIGTAIDSAIAFLNLITTTVTNVVQLVQNIIAGDWAAVWVNVQNIVEAAVATLGVLIGGLLTNFTTIFSDIVTALVNWVTNIDTETGTRLAAFVTNIATKIKDIPTKFKTTFNEIVDFLRKLDFATIGLNLITSLTDAMWDRTVGYLKPKLQGLINMIPQAVRDILGIHSPSSVFQEIGQQMIEGLSLGLTESQQQAIDALAAVFKNLTDIGNSLTLLAQFRAAPGVLANLGTMIGQIKLIVADLQGLAEWLGDPKNPSVVSAKAGTDPMVDIANNIKSMVDGLAALAEFKPVGDVTTRVTDLVNGYKEVVKQFADFAGWLVSPENFPTDQDLADAIGALSVMAGVADSFGAIFQAWSGVAKAGALTGPKNLGGMIDSIIEMLTQVVTKLGGLKLEITDELIDFAGRAADIAGAFGTIAKAWETVSGFKEAKFDATVVVNWLADLSGAMLQAIERVQAWKNITPNEAFGGFVTAIKSAVGMIAEAAKAWETIQDFDPNDKKLKLDGDEGVIAWLASLAGLATRAIEKIQGWKGIAPNETFNAFATSVKAAIGLISDAAKAWETVQDFQWNAKLKLDGDQGVIVWLATLAGLATKAIEKIQAWGGITPNETFNAFVTSVKASIGLIADVAKAWATLQDFKPNNGKLKLDGPDGVVAWLASLAGIAQAAMVEIAKKPGVQAEDGFATVMSNIRASLGALSDTMKFLEALGVWKASGNVKGKVEALTADLRIVLDTINLSYVNMRAFVSDSLLKFVAAVSDLSSGLMNVVDLLDAISAMKETGDVQLAVTRIGGLIRSVLTGLQDIIYDIDEDGAKMIGNFSSALSNLMGALKTALELALALPEKWTAPDAGMWQAFEGWVLGTFDWFYIWVTNWHITPGSATPVKYTAENMTLVGNFAQALNNLMGGLKAALELAIAVPKTWAVPDATLWNSFTTWVIQVFDWFYLWVTNWHITPGSATPVKYTTENMTLVGNFAQAMSSLMSGLKAALELAIAVPKTWSVPSGDIWNDFTAWVIGVFDWFYLWVTNWHIAPGSATPVKYTAENMTLVGNFAQAMNDLMGALKTALELAIAVPKTWAKPDPKVWADFETWVMGTFDDFASWMQTTYGGEGSPGKATLVSTFAGAMNDVMTSLKGALDLALALPGTWTAPATGAGSPYEALKTFTMTVMANFATYVQTNFPTDSEAAKNLPVVQAFAQAMDAVFGALGGALDVFTGLQGYLPLLDSRISDFIDDVKYAYGLIQTFALANTEGIAATQAFATAAQAVFSALSTALDLFKNLGGTDLTTETDENGNVTPAESFKRALQGLISRISTTFGAWKTYVETEANSTWAATASTFQSKLDAVFGTLSTALTLFTDLEKAGMPSADKITAFVNQVIGLFAQLTTGITNTPTAIGNASTATGTALTTMATTAAGKSADFTTAGASLGTALVGAVQTATTGTSAQGTMDKAFKVDQAGSLTKYVLDTYKATFSDSVGSTFGAKIADGIQYGQLSSVGKGSLDKALKVGTTGNLPDYLVTTYAAAFKSTTGTAFGVKVSEGLQAGLSSASAQGVAAQGVETITTTIKNGIKTAFGIASPSKVMMGYGQNIAAGLGQGVMAGVPGVQAAMSALYKMAQPALAGMKGEWDVNNRRVITVRFEGEAGGGVPMTAQQFDLLKRELAYAVSIGA